MYPLQLEFLTDDEKVIQLCRQYWQCDESCKFPLTVAQLAKEYGLKSGDVSNLVYTNCNAYSDNKICPVCSEPTIFQNRTDYQQQCRWPSKAQVCTECQEKEAKRVRDEQAALLEQKRRIINERFSIVSRAVNIQELSLEDAVYLLSFIRATGSEDFSYFGPLEHTTNKLSPLASYDYEIISHLCGKYIFFHPDSSPEAFEFVDGEPLSGYTYKVKWLLLTGKDIEKTRQAITAIENAFRTQEDWPPKWHEQKLALWKKVALEECLEYFKLVLEEHHLPFKPGEKTELTITNLLEQFSTAQVCSMIWSSVKNAVAFNVRQQVTKIHAANTVIGRMQSYAERAIAEGWTVKPSHRDFRCPQSIVSQVLFNTALKIGDKGFFERSHVANSDGSGAESDNAGADMPIAVEQSS